MDESAVQASHLRKAFGSKAVLQDLSFDVRAGEVVGVLGKNGAGKTTLLELMLGFTPPSAGSVRIFGEESQALSGDTKRRVGFVPQQDELLNPLTVADQLKLIAAFYPRWDHELIANLCLDWGVDTNARIKSMSVGERQKLSILLAFGHRPELLILDEPVASLDPMARRQFLEQLVNLSADGKRAVIFSSHIVSDIERLATRIWILKEGRMCWEGDLETLKESVVRLHVRGGDSPPALSIPGAITLRREAGSIVAVVRDWNDEQQQSLESRHGLTIDVEPLGLEEIFLELHR